MGDISEHFSEHEFRCHGFGHEGHPDHATIVAPELIVLLERIREHHGGPVTVVSGHRCEWWNRHVGGAPSSRHIHGDAADLEPGVVDGGTAYRLGAKGVGTNGEWATHVDTRPGRRARWRYA